MERILPQRPQRFYAKDTKKRRKGKERKGVSLKGNNGTPPLKGVKKGRKGFNTLGHKGDRKHSFSNQVFEMNTR